MASVKTKMAVGLFVVIGLVIAIIAIIWLGMSNYLQKGMYFAAYFDESVQGLDKDSPVKYQGVSIGRVHSISVAPDENLIQVILKIESGQQSEKALTEDMVARLKSVGITGIMFVELERKRPEYVDMSPHLSFRPKYPVVATRPSEIQKLFQGVDDILTQIRALDIPGITTRIKSTLDSINQAVNDLQIKEISENVRSILERAESMFGTRDWGQLIASYENAGKTLNTILSDASSFMNRLDHLLADNETAVTESIHRFQSSMTAAEGMFNRIDQMVSENEDKLGQTIDRIQDGMQTAAETLNRLDRLVADNEQGVRDVIETMNSGMNTADSALKRLDNLVAQNEETVRQLLSRFNQTLKTADSALAGVDRLITANQDGIQNAVAGFSHSIKSAEKAMARLEGMISGNEAAVTEAILSFRNAMKSAEDLMDRGRNLVENSDQGLSVLQRHLLVMLQNLEKATDNLNQFVESISNRPSQLFFGTPPPSERFESDRFE